MPGTGTGTRQALAVADATWFSTESLFREVRRDHVSTLLLKCMDYRNAWRKGVPFWNWRSGPLRRRGPSLWDREIVLPSGWMKQFPRLGMRPIARSIVDWQEREVGASRLTLVMTYPHYLHLRDLVRPERTIYFNLDDYAFYWPQHADLVHALERQAVRESELTVCVSWLRAEELRKAVPEASDRIKHLPHGAPDDSVADRPWHQPAPAPPDIAGLPRPLLGYVGTVEDRIDWKLLTRLSAAFPEASIVLVGKSARARKADWLADYRKCIARPNVHPIGWRPPETIPSYNRAFDVCMIPYRSDHPFNRVCSPTKIMDSMGSGRPIVSTALPECRLYSHLFDVAETPDAFVQAVATILGSQARDARASKRVEWARANTSAKVVDRLLDWLPDPDTSTGRLGSFVH
jgi:teichuronic acid biosynthesis glycosyltransferase TuaH